MGDTVNSTATTTKGSYYNVIFSHESYSSSKWLCYWLINIFYFTFVLLFSLLFTAAETYTVVSDYARRRGISFVPKVRKGLVITFICTYLLFFLYNSAFMIFLVIWMSLIVQLTSAGLPSNLLIVTVLMYLREFVSLNVVWQLMSLVSMLENYRGCKAIKKSKELRKGLFWQGFFVMVFPGLVMVGIEVGLLILVVKLNVLGVVGRVLLGLVIVVLNLIAILYSLVIEALFSFVSKSLTTHLSESNDLSAGPGPPKDVQMGEDVNNV